jgi:hypothetical protein
LDYSAMLCARKASEMYWTRNWGILYARLAKQDPIPPSPNLSFARHAQGIPTPLVRTLAFHAQMSFLDLSPKMRARQT